ncbi:MAG: response regulator transcription factor [Bifidobacterium mongoliense]
MSMIPNAGTAFNPERLTLPHILLIEDDHRLGSMLHELLLPDYRVDWVTTQAEGLRLAAAGGYDCLVVDRRLPDGDGLEIVRAERGVGHTTPAMLVTALGDTDDIVQGLDEGANDYLTKPFHFSEFSARLRALIRGYHAPSQSIEIGDWTLKPITCSIESPTGERVELTSTELSLLTLLASSPNHVFSRAELLNGVFSEGTSAGTIDVYISYLRKKTVHDLVDTVRGRGYLIGEPRAQ